MLEPIGYWLTCVLIGIWCLVSSFEWISNLKLLRRDGLLGWPLLSLRAGRIYRSAWLVLVFSERGTVIILTMRSVAAAVLTLVAWLPLSLALGVLAVIVLTSWLLMMRARFGGDGSDQMGLIVSIGALIHSLGRYLEDPAAAFAGSLLIGGQLTLSYFVAGFSKLLSPTWRSGTALIGVMGTHGYGHPIAARIASGSPSFSSFFCWLVILGETLFPVALLFPPILLGIVMFCFLLFHLSNALFMGLNSFVWTFAATYPSVFYLSHLLRLTLNGLVGPH